MGYHTRVPYLYVPKKGCIIGRILRKSDSFGIFNRVRIADKRGAAQEGAELKAVLKNGREITETTSIARGDHLGNPLSKDEPV
jgi:hypothetical protein